MLNATTAAAAGVDAGGEAAPTPPPCPPEDPFESAALSALSFWGEGVLMLLICAAGLAGNLAAVPVLLSRKMASTFNRLLVFLSVYDAAFLVCTASEAWRRHFPSSSSTGFSDAHLLLFVHFVYQAQNVALVCSTYTTVVVAVERYLAVTRPVEYHLSVVAGGAAGVSPWRRVWRYMAPTLALGVLFNLPKFFEFVTVRKVVALEPPPGAEEDEAAAAATNVSVLTMKPTRMRLDDAYVFAYVNLARLIVEGLVPFCSLVFLNSGIHRAIKQRRANNINSSSNNNIAAAGSVASGINTAGGGGRQHQQQQQQQQRQQHDSEETRQALVLFFIVASFLVCNIPRVVLNVYETLTVGRMRNDRCFSLPVWVSVTAVISYVLIATNSSVNFFLYCLVNPTFRAEFVSRFRFLSSWRKTTAAGARNLTRGGTTSMMTTATTITRNTTVMDRNTKTTAVAPSGEDGAGGEASPMMMTTTAMKESLVVKVDDGSEGKGVQKKV